MSETVTRAHLVDKIYRRFGYSRAECSDIIDSIIEEINDGLDKEGEVKLSSFGTFKVRSKKARVGRNPKTKKEVPISARKVVSFYASNILKDLINK
ncbi:integration host factor subunit alpha [Rickettsiales bacterium]|nr:integration host factor subunit alpha [Rickettsiales bacterium]